METQTSANSVADLLVWLAAHECESDPDFLTPLKLQKLLYYVQGWTLVEWNRPMFRENIEAWRDGPVVPEVYRRFKGVELRPIVSIGEGSSDGRPAGLSAEEQSIVRSVWNTYKMHSAFALRDMTHSELPWRSCYESLDAEGRSQAVIPVETIAVAFKERAESVKRRLASKREALHAAAAANTMRLTGQPVIGAVRRAS